MTDGLGVNFWRVQHCVCKSAGRSCLQEPETGLVGARPQLDNGGVKSNQTPATIEDFNDNLSNETINTLLLRRFF
jgi:hypothetical protein